MTLNELLRDLPLCYARGGKFDKVIEEAAALAATDVTVYFRGESGTGKSRLAFEVHKWSRRVQAGFLRANPSDVGDDLVGSDLAGHRKGAFSSADRDRPGVFLAHTGGTVLLDEVDAYGPKAVQFLMAYLDTHEVRPVGADRPVPVTVRMLMTSNRDVEAMAAKGEFRRELWWRLAPQIIDVPPLRERREDIALLVGQILAGLSKDMFGPAMEIEPAAMDALMERPWPGNVRELAMAVQDLMFECRSAAVITAAAVNARCPMPVTKKRCPTHRNSYHSLS